MKLVLLAALAASSVVIPASSRSDPINPIVIEGPARAGLVYWKQSVVRELDRNLAYPRSYPGWDMPEGTVAVQFICGEDGKPASVELSRSSGNRALDRAALRAVERISTLHPLPAEISDGAALRANVIFATDHVSLARQEKGLRKEEAQLAERERKDGRQVVVLETSLRTAG